MTKSPRSPRRRTRAELYRALHHAYVTYYEEKVTYRCEADFPTIGAYAFLNGVKSVPHQVGERRGGR